ncbi:dUTP diphosphatase [Piedraia hortae CBS 480.64]|uniref:Deoxyuridine 5'-triphosphate nucleotidohydrolase n=1 Tax=Piedraia hortae CBS 480.64 TaxID=1314780 RepID=A0A6A7BVF2_9PEZI|nr:dUTP diphosphatase [Piedraia hortae CBS 480.64]
MEATPAPDPPQSPTSPAPKRTKYTEPAANLAAAAVLQDKQATPTPELHSAPVMANSSALQVKLLAPSAKPPTRGSAFAAGYDLYASRSISIPARGRVLVDTDISIAVPLGTYGRVAPRSGLASKHGIDTGAGVIDADYRGPVKVLLFNLSEEDFRVEVGDRVAQLILEKIETPEVAVVEMLQTTVRGEGGFGSTGGFGKV